MRHLRRRTSTSTSTGNVTFSSLIQSRVPQSLRGRAFAGFDTLWKTYRLLSLLGVLADTVGIRAVYLLGGLLLLTPPPSARPQRWPPRGQKRDAS